MRLVNILTQLAEPGCVLALGTSGPWCTVAVRRCGADGVRIERRDELSGPGRSGRILAMIDRLRRDLQISWSQIDALAFDAGPGAFTGLRVACGVAQGLGFAIERPLLAVGSQAALAWRAPADTRVFVAADARMGETYCAVFDRGAGCEPLPVAGPMVLAPDQAQVWFAHHLPAGAMAAVAIGDGFDRYPTLQAWALEQAMPVSHQVFPAADALAQIGAAAWRRGQAMAPADAAPIYIRDKVALDVDEQARLRAGNRA